MIGKRIIPILLLHKNGLYKTVEFKNANYIGDPINAVKIFNEKEVDELSILDIDATREDRAPDFKKILEITSEAFMPISYGGGITKIEEIKELFFSGVEKVILNSIVHTNPDLVRKASDQFGSQSIIVSIDVKKNFFKGYSCFIKNGTININKNPIDFAKEVESMGAGEILLNNISRDGTFKGYDNDLITQVSQSVGIPVIATGGASDYDDLTNAIKSGASAAAAGSIFVYKMPHKAVLINYPKR